jgi:hypothetical protein
MERSPTDVHAAPLAAAPADTAMNMATPPSPSIAQATDSRQQGAGCAKQPPPQALHGLKTRPGRPEMGDTGIPNQHPALHITPPLRVGVFKTRIDWPSPSVNGPMRSDFFKPAERPGNLSDLRQTYPAPDHTTTDELSRGSRRETRFTKDTKFLPQPDAPAPEAEPANNGQATSLPKPKNLHLTEDHLRPVYGSEPRKEPPYRYPLYPYSHLALAQALQGKSLPHRFILLQKDHSLNHEQRAGVCAPSLLPVAASQHITFRFIRRTLRPLARAHRMASGLSTLQSGSPNR